MFCAKAGPAAIELASKAANRAIITDFLSKRLPQRFVTKLQADVGS